MLILQQQFYFSCSNGLAGSVQTIELLKYSYVLLFLTKSYAQVQLLLICTSLVTIVTHLKYLLYQVHRAEKTVDRSQWCLLLRPSMYTLIFKIFVFFFCTASQICFIIICFHCGRQKSVRFGSIINYFCRYRKLKLLFSKCVVIFNAICVFSVYL